MYLGDAQSREDRRALRDMRRSERQAIQAERREDRANARVLRTAARNVPLPPIATTPSEGSPVVTGTIPASAEAPSSAQSAGGSSTVNVAAPTGGNFPILPLLAVGAALLLF
jgi:hypothetical protein